ncbi:hypothetical protein CYMTET_18870 [Cymbomonas tetramitiformis]|uniref:BZIP domain-containing protein n=1 Tax=Cymbomonas tetramitiformis TaxID=36881 RepID=A0AAE0L5T7_9CHLO|nr:hypothetical protein CYMTET_18870 [Cymbomonas tetramitiformis]
MSDTIFPDHCDLDLRDLFVGEPVDFSDIDDSFPLDDDSFPLDDAFISTLFLQDTPTESFENDVAEDASVSYTSNESIQAELSVRTSRKRKVRQSSAGSSADETSYEGPTQPQTKVERKRERNRANAALSRWRKKNSLNLLEGKNAKLEQENARLHYMLSCITSENEALRSQLLRAQTSDFSGHFSGQTTTAKPAVLRLAKTKYASPAEQDSLQLELLQQYKSVRQILYSVHRHFGLLFLFLVSLAVPEASLEARRLTSKEGIHMTCLIIKKATCD